MLLPILIGHFHDEGIGQQLSEFFFLPSHLNLLNQYATSAFPIMHLIPPPPKKKIVQALPSVDFFGQLNKPSPASDIYKPRSEPFSVC